MQLFASCNGQEKKETTVENDRTERITSYKKTLDSINYSLNWTETTFGLWKSKNGDLALKTSEGTDVGISIDKYIQHLTDGRPLSEVIDTATFQYLGSSFYKDINYIYTNFAMADGGNFWIVEDADVKTFKLIGNSCYAKDKNYIFEERKMKLDSVDYQTFRTWMIVPVMQKTKTGILLGATEWIETILKTKTL